MAWSKDFVATLNAAYPKIKAAISDDGQTLNINLDEVGLNWKTFVEGWFTGLSIASAQVAAHVTIDTEHFEYVSASAKRHGFALKHTATPNRYRIVVTDDTQPLPALEEEIND